jgi:hypothetical protein
LNAGLYPAFFYPQWGIVYYQTGQFYHAVISSKVSARFLIVLCRSVDTDQVAFAEILYNT